MKKSLKILATTLFCTLFLVLFMSLGAMNAYAEIYSGECGLTEEDDVRWELDTEEGILNIWGHGNMRNWNVETEPWQEWRVYREYINGVFIQDGVTSVGESAFYNCKKLLFVYVPPTVETIGSYAFKNCMGLIGLSVPEGLTEIGNYAFGDCRKFTYISLPTGIKRLSQGMFKDCVKLKRIDLPTGLEEVGIRSFWNCQSLESITLPETTTTIAGEAFKMCYSLKNVYMPETLSKINPKAFDECSSLESIVLPRELKSLKRTTFNNCNSLKYLSIGPNVSTLEEEIFNNWNPELMVDINYGPYSDMISDYLTKLGIANNVDYHETDEYIYTLRDGNAYIVKCKNIQRNMVVPAELEGHLVTDIGASVFENQYNLNSVVLPATLKSIGNNAFYKCNTLMEVTNYSDLNLTLGASDNGYVAAYAINIRKSEEEPTAISRTEDGFIFASQPSKNYLIGYEGTDSVVVLPDSYTTATGDTISKYKILKYAFANNKTMAECVVSSSITSIGTTAFYRCLYLNRLEIPESVTSIGTNEFVGSNPMVRVDCYEGSYAHQYAIDNKLNYNIIVRPPVLTELTEDMVTLDESVFEWTGDYTIPEVTVVNNGTPLVLGQDYTLDFADNINVGTAKVIVKGCGLYTGVIEKTYTIELYNGGSYIYDNIEYRISNYDSVNSNYTVEVTGIGQEEVTKLTIPKYVLLGGVKFNVASMATEAFAECTSIKNVVISANVTMIPSKAFYKCSNLKNITIEGNGLKSVGKKAISGTNSKLKIYVSSKKLKSYKKLFTADTGFVENKKQIIAIVPQEETTTPSVEETTIATEETTTSTEETTATEETAVA